MGYLLIAVISSVVLWSKLGSIPGIHRERTGGSPTLLRHRRLLEEIAHMEALLGKTRSNTGGEDDEEDEANQGDGAGDR